jgi:hypothetical protein
VKPIILYVSSTFQPHPELREPGMARAAKKVLGRRPGPKPRGPFEDKQATLTTRITASTRRHLEEAAEASGLSLSQEIERRLERSFKEDYADDEVIRERWGDKLTYRLTKILAEVKMLIEARTGQDTFEDWETAYAVEQAWRKLVAGFLPSIPREASEEVTALDPGPPPEPPVLPVLPRWISGPPTEEQKKAVAEYKTYEAAYDEWERAFAAYQDRLARYGDALNRSLDRFKKLHTLGEEAAIDFLPESKTKGG